jgi:hypothetical protein
MTTTKLTYRLYDSKDMEGVLHLWEQYSGWGAITHQEFEDWYLNTPYGSCIVVIATDETDNVVGQLVFTPSHVHLDSIEVKALRAGAPILHESLKNGRITHYDHPVFAMFRKGMEVAKQQGFSLIYLFPALGWTTVLKLFPKYGLPDVEVASYGCFKISLEDSSTFYTKQDESYVELLENKFNHEYDHLWKEAALQFPINCGVVRNSKWLNWKLSGHRVFVIKDKRSKQLKGYVAIRKDSGLIVDALAGTKVDLKNILVTLVHAIHHLNPNRLPVKWTNLNGMYTPLFQSLFPDTEIDSVNYTFAFGCYPLAEGVSQIQIEPSNWYMMPND